MKKIIITGGSGFLGTEIIKTLLDTDINRDYEIVVLDIAPPRVKDDRVSFVNKNLLEPFEANPHERLKHPYSVIHLSGKNIFGRFTEKHKRLIYDTRIIGTRNLVELLSQKDYRPRYFICASAVGFYGDRPGEELDESSDSHYETFLSKVVRDWELECQKASRYGIRTSSIRNGHIIGRGGLLSASVAQFKGPFGTILGNGHQYMPWIDIRDLVQLYLQHLKHENVPAVINGVSNSFETQKDFSQAIGSIKNTYFYISIQRWMLALVFKGFADEMLIDQKISSSNYSHMNYQIRHADLKMSVAYFLSSPS